MHKSKREGLRRRTEAAIQAEAKARRIENKIQALTFSGNPESRKELKRMAENRHWYDRNPKGALLSASDKSSGNCIIL